MAENNVIEQLDELYNMVAGAWSVPLGNDKCIIERERAIRLIDSIKNGLPTALAEANRLVAQRDEFVGNAKREAEALRKSAEEKARVMVDEQEIVRTARATSASLISTANAKSREIYRAMNDFIEDNMRDAEESLSRALEIVRAKHGEIIADVSRTSSAAPAPRRPIADPEDED